MITGIPPRSISSANFLAMCLGRLAKLTHLSRGIGGTPLVVAVLVALVGEGAHEPDLPAHVVALDPQGRAHDEHVDRLGARELGRLAVDPAVDVDLATDCPVTEQLASRETLLGHDVLHERLAAEARFDGHDQDDVDQLAVRLERRDGRSRLDGQSGRSVGLTDAHERRLDLVGRDLDVERDRVAARVDELVDVLGSGC